MVTRVNPITPLFIIMKMYSVTGFSKSISALSQTTVLSWLTPSGWFTVDCRHSTATTLINSTQSEETHSTTQYWELHHRPQAPLWVRSWPWYAQGLLMGRCSKHDHWNHIFIVLMLFGMCHICSYQFVLVVVLLIDEIRVRAPNRSFRLQECYDHSLHCHVHRRPRHGHSITIHSDSRRQLQ